MVPASLTLYLNTHIMSFEIGQLGYWFTLSTNVLNGLIVGMTSI
ncbi:hypothetical protein C427_4478 [Paraglaciecola psychrophila 170]|uniref:Uncharacterized protein n=1 Tax=Paraglaciecola psychrophila 170 TaxID=1129794 RepID=K6ZT45_9ALTE|nr:hypothetical protein C427_4478 [Paraglaciecola psychrophila 170]GAC39091.1 hypothetical protein GPSY_3480 [Paraglaciecola psychrophila 170]